MFDAQACENEETFPLYIEPTTAFDLKPSLAIKGSFDTGKLLLRVLRRPNQYALFQIFFHNINVGKEMCLV